MDISNDIIKYFIKYFYNLITKSLTFMKKYLI